MPPATVSGRCFCGVGWFASRKTRPPAAAASRKRMAGGEGTAAIVRSSSAPPARTKMARPGRGTSRRYHHAVPGIAFRKGRQYSPAAFPSREEGPSTKDRERPFVGPRRYASGFVSFLGGRPATATMIPLPGSRSMRHCPKCPLRRTKMRCLVSRTRPGLVLTSAAMLALATLLPGPVHAQVLYGSIVGNVADTTKAAVPGATVTIIHKETNLARESSTSSDGTYRFVNVQPGTYMVRVALAGFKESVKENVPVSANAISRVDFGLEVGQLTEAVTVQSEQKLLQTDSGSVTAELKSKEITSLPLGNYRNYQSLLNLVPGTTPAGFQNAVTDTPARALTTNVNGTARTNNNTRLDGTTNIYIWLPHHAVYVAPAETVETVNVTTNNFDAEQGMAGGAAVSVLTKSGTNEFHGSGFALHEDQGLRARNFFNTASRDLPSFKSHRNIDGATLGGPVIKNKLKVTPTMLRWLLNA